jgi:hypothetical protein
MGVPLHDHGETRVEQRDKGGNDRKKAEVSRIYQMGSRQERPPNRGPSILSDRQYGDDRQERRTDGTALGRHQGVEEVTAPREGLPTNPTQPDGQRRHDDNRRPRDG